MRDFKGMKRQRSRNRNGGGGGGGGGGSGGKPQHNANRAFDSNGPEGVKVRGAAQHVYEKYQQLARDAQTAGDRVLAENYLQHAEHYFRLMRAMQPLRPLSEIIGRDQFVSGYDIDFEDDGGAADSADAETDGDTAESAENGADRQPRFEPRNRDDQPRAERANGDRGQNERVQNERFQNDRPRDDRGGRFNREDRPRFQRDDRVVRTERTDRVERSERPERSDRDPLGVIEPESTPLTAAPTPYSPPAPQASAAGLAADAPILRADDGDISHAPAFLQVRTTEAKSDAAEQPRRPRRRRTPASFGPTDAAPSEPDAN